MPIMAGSVGSFAQMTYFTQGTHFKLGRAAIVSAHFCVHGFWQNLHEIADFCPERGTNRPGGSVG
jgi:hypothetical protein